MLSDFSISPIGFFFSLVSLVMAISIHEFAHAYIADRLGDPTPRIQGRVTLNPLAHLDPIGTVALLLFGFGWGKPVQFDPFNLRHPARDTSMIALAGPISNLILASLCSIILHIAAFSLPTIVLIFFIVLIKFNILLAVFNLLPIYPLDGFNIVAGLLPEKKSKEWRELSNYGIIFLIVLIVPLAGGSILGKILTPPITLLESLLIPLSLLP